MTQPVPFEIYRPGLLLHGTRADLRVGDLLMPGHPSNFKEGLRMRHVYVTETLDAAAWGAELCLGDAPARIYIVEPTWPIEDDPNVTDKKFPGNPTRSYRTLGPVRIVGEVTNWVGHDPVTIEARRTALANLKQRGADLIID